MFSLRPALVRATSVTRRHSLTRIHVATLKQTFSGDAAKVYDVHDRVRKNAYIKSMDEYSKMYKESIHNPDSFWKDHARSLTWIQPFSRVQSGTLEKGDVKWFEGGKLNVSVNCLDRHVNNKNGNKIAIIWEGDDASAVRKLTYKELYEETCRLANGLRSLGVKKGDTVAIHMPNTPEAAMAMLACARIGAVHSVIFAGFSPESIASRVNDCKARVVITSSSSSRGGKPIKIKQAVDEALKYCKGVEHVIVHKRSDKEDVPMGSHDIFMQDLVSKQPRTCEPEPMDSEDPLFLLYTSGSTGKPKGVVHTQAGYLLMTSLTHKYVFDVHEDDIFACLADVGWITGHSYIVYGPLCNGATTFMFESTPLYPDAGRYWDMVQRHKITSLYTAPTALRSLMKFDDSFVKKYDRSSLRVLGSVGEPINPESWRWYHDVVGDGQCAIVDTYWQTETGAHVLTPLPGATPLKPGSGTFPFFGVELALLEPKSGKVLQGNSVEGVLAITKPWPAMARTIYGDHERFLQTYMTHYPGKYFTGDGARRDADGYYWIGGRVDDVINVSGHRIGTAEVESALVEHQGAAEAAVVGFPHPIKGQGIAAFVTMKDNVATKDNESQLEQELRAKVRLHIGPFAAPDVIVITSALPKTRSGKIMRRILRKIAAHETDEIGDVTALAEPEVVGRLIEKFKARKV